MESAFSREAAADLTGGSCSRAGSAWRRQFGPSISAMAADLTKLASQLVRDLKTAFWLPPYDTANVSKVIEQMVELHDRAKAEQEVPSFDSQDPRDTCAPMVLLLAMIRNRDLLVSYLRYRTQQIEQRRWDTTGSVIGDPRNILSEHEKTYEFEYNKLLAQYQAEFNLDLSRDLEPPQDLMIKVYVPEDVGQFIGPESGANLDLRAGDEVFLRRGDVEALLRQGLVQHVA